MVTLPPVAKLILPPPTPVMDSIPVRSFLKYRPVSSTLRFSSPSFSLTLIFLSVMEIPLPSVKVTPAICFFTYSTLVTDSLLLALTLVTYAFSVVTLVRPVRSLPNLTTTFLPVLLTTMLSSPMNFTVSPAPTLVAVPFSVATVQPLPTSVVKLSTLLLVSCNWPKFTASFVSVPFATF